MRIIALFLALTFSVASHAGQVQQGGPPAHAQGASAASGAWSPLTEFAQAGRPWRCTSVNSRGRAFTGRGSTREQARRTAMNRCTARSNSCRLRGCG